MMADSRGIGWMNSSTGKVYYANNANGLLQQDTIAAMTQSTNGSVYLVSQNGVHVSNASLQKFEFFAFATGVIHQPPLFFGEVYSNYYSIASLPGNRLAVAGAGKIILLDIYKKTARVYPMPLNTSGLPTDARLLQIDGKGRLYFAVHGKVFRLSDNGELKLLWENTSHPGLRISAIFIDRSDVLWVSVNAQGLLKIDLQALPFQSYRYTTNFMTDILEQAG
jgi:ligand-binding sensor domain-containing protein